MQSPENGRPPEETDATGAPRGSTPIAASYDLGAPPRHPGDSTEEKRSLNLYLPFGLGLSVLGLAVPLLFGPLVTMIGLEAWTKHRDKAWVVILLGVLLIIHGLIYYRLATAGGMR